MHAGESSGFWPAFVGIAGALPLLSLLWLYKSGVIAYSQLGAIRTWGCMIILALLALGLAAGLALVGAAVPATRGQRPIALARAIFYAGAVAQLIMVGLVIFFASVRYAPGWAQAAACLAWAALMGAYASYAPADRAFLTNLLTRGAFAAVVVQLAGIPVVAMAATRDHYAFPQPPVRGPEALAAQAPRRIVLVTFDGLRLRGAGPLSTTPSIMPELAALAAESTWFTHCLAASDATQLSVPAILAGVGPGAFFPSIGTTSSIIREGYLTGLAGYLKAVGYHTAFATMFVQPSHFGMTDEFDEGVVRQPAFQENRFNGRAFLPWTALFGAWHHDMRSQADKRSATGEEVLAARATFDRGLALLQGPQAKAFAWLHVGVPHTPYYDVAAGDRGGSLRPASYHAVTSYDMMGCDAKTLRHYERTYEAYVRFADAELGRFVRQLKAAGLWQDTLLVVTSDHGESFAMPGYYPHGNGLLTEDVVRVPLLVHAPGQHVGRRVDGLAAHKDILPTVLGFVYHAPPTAFQGVAQPAQVDPRRVVFAWNRRSAYVKLHLGFQSIAAYDRRYKYLLLMPERKEQLFDIATDEWGLRDVAAQHPDELRRLRALTHAKYPADF